MEARLIRCIGKVHSVLLACLKVVTLSEESIRAAIIVSSFRGGTYFGSIALSLEKSVKHAIRLQKPSLHAACLEEMGFRMVYNPDSRASAEACLEELESVNLLRNLPESSDQLAFTLTVLAELLYLQKRNEEGIRCCQESVRLIKESTPPITSAMAYILLGIILMENRNFQEWTKAMDLAASCFEPNNYPILALAYSTCISMGVYQKIHAEQGDRSR